MNSRVSKSILSLGLALWLGLLLQLVGPLECKPHKLMRQDPMLNLPGEIAPASLANVRQPVQYIHEYHTVESDNQEPSGHQVQYIQYTKDGSSASNLGPPEKSNEPGQQYMIVEQPGQSVPYESALVASDKNQPDTSEYVIAGNQETDGTIGHNMQHQQADVIYIDQNGQEVKPQSESYQQQLASADDAPNMASYVSSISGLAATILTEVPISDMPEEVLSKLKREFGVRVVATRTHPGANLVISCDDVSPGSLVCSPRETEYRHQAKQDRPQREYPSSKAYIQYETSTRDSEETATEQPQYRAESPQSRTNTQYEHQSEQQTSPEPELQQQPRPSNLPEPTTKSSQASKTSRPRHHRTQKHDDYVYTSSETPEHNREEESCEEEKTQEVTKGQHMRQQSSQAEGDSLGSQQQTTTDQSQSGFDEPSQGGQEDTRESSYRNRS